MLEWSATTGRYSLHELVRTFAAGRLEDGDRVRLRHAQHYARAAQHADELYLQGGDILLAGLGLFDQERPHIDLGWGWARERAGNGDADALLLAYANATDYIGLLCYDTRRERIPQLEAWLAATQRLKRRRAEGAALGNLGLAYRNLGDARRAITFYEQQLVIARELGDHRGEGIASWNLGLALEKQGELARAAELMQIYVDYLRAIGHPDAELRASQLEQLRQRLASD